MDRPTYCGHLLELFRASTLPISSKVDNRITPFIEESRRYQTFLILQHLYQRCQEVTIPVVSNENKK